MKSKLSILISLFLYFSFTHNVFAATCDLAKIEAGATGQNYDVTYCVTATSQSEAQSIQKITATCRSAPGGVTANCACHPADWYTNPLTMIGAYAICQGQDAASSSQNVSATQVAQNADGTFLTCFTLTSLDRNMGTIDVNFTTNTGAALCPPQTTNVTPGNYGGLWEYFQNTVATRTNLIPTYSPVANGVATCVDGKKINTALGCISVDFASGGFATDILKISVGLGGGFALLLILYGIFIITSSAGIPEKLQQGQEIITSAVVGLIMIIMSIVLLNLIGVKILAIPGL